MPRFNMGVPEKAGQGAQFGPGQQQPDPTPEMWWQRPEAQHVLPGAQNPYDPSGRYPDPIGYTTTHNLMPQAFIGPLVNSPAAQEYKNVGQTVAAQGVQAGRAGEQAAIKESAQTSASQGLGRGFQAQQEADIRQQGTLAATSAIMSGRLEQVARNFELESLFAESLIEANKARFTSYLQRKAIKAGQQSGFMSMLGGIAQGVGSIVGGAIA